MESCLKYFVEEEDFYQRKDCDFSLAYRLVDNQYEDAVDVLRSDSSILGDGVEKVPDMQRVLSGLFKKLSAEQVRMICKKKNPVFLIEPKYNQDNGKKVIVGWMAGFAEGDEELEASVMPWGIYEVDQDLRKLLTPFQYDLLARILGISGNIMDQINRAVLAEDGFGDCSHEVIRKDGSVLIAGYFAGKYSFYRDEPRSLRCLSCVCFRYGIMVNI